MFNIGDKVVYPMHGAGIIEGIEEKSVLGEKQNYYIIKMPGEVKVMVPTAKAEGIGVRDVISEETAVKHLRELAVTEKQAVRFCNGGQLGFDRIKITDITDGELFRVKSNDKLLGIGFADNEKCQIGIKCIINYL